MSAVDPTGRLPHPTAYALPGVGGLILLPVLCGRRDARVWQPSAAVVSLATDKWAARLARCDRTMQQARTAARKNCRHLEGKLWTVDAAAR